MNIKGNSLPTIFKSTLPDRINFNALVSEPNELANLLVPNATAGGIPMANKAGVEINPPPPTTESIKAARNPNTMTTIIKVMSHSMLYYPLC